MFMNVVLVCTETMYDEQPEVCLDLVLCTAAFAGRGGAAADLVGRPIRRWGSLQPIADGSPVHSTADSIPWPYRQHFVFSPGVRNPGSEECLWNKPRRRPGWSELLRLPDRRLRPVSRCPGIELRVCRGGQYRGRAAQ